MRRPITSILRIPVALAIAGCVSDSPGGSGAVGPTSSQYVQPTDPAINPNDTYIAFDASVTADDTVDLSQPTINPATGQPVTSLAVPDGPDTNFHVEAGYDVDGQLRADLVGSWPTTLDSTSVRVPDAYHLVLSKGQMSEYAASGAPVDQVATPDGAAPAAAAVLPALGANLLYGSITDGVLVDSLRASPSVAVSASLNVGRIVQSVAAPGGGPQGAEHVERKYHREGARWVLDEIASESDQAGGGIRVRGRHALRLRNVRWQVNARLDSIRAERRRTWTAGSGTPGTGLASAPPAVPQGPMMMMCYEDCPASGGGGGGGGGYYPPSPPPPPPPRNVVFQHGLLGNGGIWSRMQSWLTPEYSFGTVLAPSLSNPGARAQDQTNELVSILAGTGKTGFLVVGHSMGGLVARRAAQQRPDLVNGVLTVGTPHLGAMLAATTRPVVSGVLGYASQQLLYGCDPNATSIDAACWLGLIVESYVISAVVDWAADQVQQGVPAIQDLEPVQYVPNPFLHDLNLATETFPRAGIQSYPSKRWVLFRYYGDYRCFPEAGCGGRSWARWTGRVYSAFKVCRVVSALFLDVYWFNWCNNKISAMNLLDGIWDQLTAPHDARTDGLVQGSSQVYPGTPYNYQIFGGDSHPGEPNSNLTRSRIEQVFDGYFLVPRIR